MDAQLQQEIQDAALDFWIEWNYCAEHAWSYLGNDAWLDDDEEGSENNKEYKSIIDEKITEKEECLQCGEKCKNLKENELGEPTCENCFEEPLPWCYDEHTECVCGFNCAPPS
jgi:hypothetical protein